MRFSDHWELYTLLKGGSKFYFTYFFGPLNKISSVWECMKVLVCVIDKNDRLWTQCGRMNSRLKKPMTLFSKASVPKQHHIHVSPKALCCNFFEDHCGCDLWIIGSKTKHMYVVHLLADWELVSTFACVSWHSQWHSPTAAVVAPQVRCSCCRPVFVLRSDYRRQPVKPTAIFL